MLKRTFTFLEVIPTPSVFNEIKLIKVKYLVNNKTLIWNFKI